MAVFDLETSGVSTANDLIVTAYFGFLTADGTVAREQEWIVNPGIDIPTGASDVHGWTTERLAETPGIRQDLDAVTLEIASLIHALCGPQNPNPLPLGGHNISFDLSMLNAHLRRQSVAPLPFGENGIKVLDSLVLDKHFNRFLKGKGQRKLTPTAARYGILLTEEQAHDASFDAIASGRIIQAVLARYAPQVATTPTQSVAQLHNSQRGWYATQQADLQKWLRKGTDPTAVLETSWPTHDTTPTPAPEGVTA
ncbi:exonuclease domain-containing protein [Frigoribacterium sp. CG_9.8]|uniref:exonuclease domain-containing protein n=1 Tax=Frigoribacterium sp. CG_9.8 TaxID=2787733 RepID=UPI0018CBDFB8|nr:exonuclease domain-containing protein [Frigoribacterium sp. CG_9.8]MBG6106568.1 DNA polymerase-3 subunit epsilon [Frigoribacterium sp. CG_9.8]